MRGRGGLRVLFFFETKNHVKTGTKPLNRTTVIRGPYLMVCVWFGLVHSERFQESPPECSAFSGEHLICCAPPSLKARGDSCGAPLTSFRCSMLLSDPIGSEFGLGWLAGTPQNCLLGAQALGVRAAESDSELGRCLRPGRSGKDELSRSSGLESVRSRHLLAESHGTWCGAGRGEVDGC